MDGGYLGERKGWVLFSGKCFRVQTGSIHTFGSGSLGGGEEK